MAGCGAPDVLVAYNAFEKLRDPSHGFAPPLETWVHLLEQQNFSIVAREQFGKEIDFASWVSRMRCAPEVVAVLETTLSEGPPQLRKFLAPRRGNDGALHFTLQELLLAVLILATAACSPTRAAPTDGTATVSHAADLPTRCVGCF